MKLFLVFVLVCAFTATTAKITSCHICTECTDAETAQQKPCTEDGLVKPSTGSTPGSSAATIPDSSASTIPDSSAATIPDSSAATIPDSSATTIPDSSAATIPDSSAATIPDSSAATQSDDTNSGDPENTLSRNKRSLFRNQYLRAADEEWFCYKKVYGDKVDRGCTKLEVECLAVNKTQDAGTCWSCNNDENCNLGTNVQSWTFVSLMVICIMKFVL